MKIQWIHQFGWQSNRKCLRAPICHFEMGRNPFSRLIFLLQAIGQWNKTIYFTFTGLLSTANLFEEGHRGPGEVFFHFPILGEAQSLLPKRTMPGITSRSGLIITLLATTPRLLTSCHCCIIEHNRTPVSHVIVWIVTIQSQKWPRPKKRQLWQLSPKSEV